MEVFCIMKNLKSLRLKNNLTQAALAKELNVTQNAVYQWENGKREPSSEMVEKIANYFKVSPNYLMGWEQKKGIDSTIANNIVKYRKLYKISQKQLADYLGISTNVLSKIEKGEISPSPDEVIKISKGLGLPLEDLLDFPERDDVEIQNEFLSNLFSKAGYFIFKVTADGSEKYWIYNQNAMYEIDIDTFNLFISSLNDYFLFNLQKMLNKFEPKVLKKQKGNSTDSDPNAEDDSRNDE